MKRFVTAALVGVGMMFAASSTLRAQARPSSPPGAAASRVAVCSLLPKAQVKKHLPWNEVLDRMPIEEEPVGASGSSCNYPSVFIQVLPFTQNLVDAVRKQGGVEPVSGVGDEAYFRHNPAGYAELYVKVGGRALTLQASVDGNMATVKPATISLAKELVATLR